MAGLRAGHFLVHRLESGPPTGDITGRTQIFCSDSGFSRMVEQMGQAGETLRFEAEVTRLLSLMVHSVYSNRDVFLRELISNAADACERLRYRALIVGGVLCGIAGAYLSTAHNAAFVRDMTAGKGYLALAAAAWRKGRTGDGAAIAIQGAFLLALDSHYAYHLEMVD